MKTSHILKYFRRTSNKHYARLFRDVRNIIICIFFGKMAKVIYKTCYNRSHEWKSRGKFRYIKIKKRGIIRSKEKGK